jgi:hypothetical protein
MMEAELTPILQLTEYEFRHLVEHLATSGKVKELHNLLSLETSNKHNAWYEARLDFGDIQGYLDDINLAWKLTEYDNYHLDKQDRVAFIGLQVRYALIQASIRNLAMKIPPVLLGVAVAQCLVSPSLGLTYALQMTNVDTKVKALTEIVPHLTEAMQQRAIREVMTLLDRIEEPSIRLKALIVIIPSLSGIQQRDASIRALKILSHSELNDVELAGILRRLVPFLNSDLQREALKVTQGFHDVDFRMEVQIDLLPYFSESLLQEMIDLAHNIKHDHEWTQDLIKFAPHLTEALIVKALAATKKVSSEYYRVTILVELVPLLPETLKKDAIRDAMTAARSVKWKWPKVKALAMIMPFILGESVQEISIEALTVTKQIKNKHHRIRALNLLIPYLSENLRRYALGEIISGAEKTHDLRVLGEIMSCIPEDTQKKVIRRIRKTIRKTRKSHDTHMQAKTLAEIAATLEGSLGEKVWLLAWEATQKTLSKLYILQTFELDNLLEIPIRLIELGYIEKVFEATQEIKNSYFTANLLINLAPFLSRNQLREGIASLARSFEVRYQAQIIANIEKNLAQDLLVELLNKEQVIGDYSNRWIAIAKLTPFLEKGQLQDLLLKVRKIEEAHSRDSIFNTIATHYAELGRLKEAHELLQQIENAETKTEALASFLPYLNKTPYQQQVLKNIQHNRSVKVKTRAWILIRALPELTGKIKDQTLHAVFSLIRQIEPYTLMRQINTWNASEMLDEIAPHLSIDVIRKILVDARKIWFYQDLKAELLASLVLPLAELGFPQDALKIAQGIREDRSRRLALLKLGGYLKKDQLSELLSESHVEKEIDYLAPHLPEDLLVIALEDVLEFRFAYPKARGLVAIIPYLPRNLRSKSLDELLTTFQDLRESRTKREITDAIIRLSPNLTDKLLIKTLLKMREIEEESWVHLLVSLIDRFPKSFLYEQLPHARNLSDAYLRGKALVVLANSQTKNSFVEILYDVITNSQDVMGWQGQDILTRIANCLSAKSEYELDTTIIVWQKALHIFGNRSRSKLLSDASYFFPYIVSIGGADAMNEIYYSILDVGRWWP